MQVNILCNMAEVVVRLVEASWAQGAARAASATKLSRALSAYTVPLLFMDTGVAAVGPARGWRLLYLNGSAAKLLGALIIPPLLLLLMCMLCKYQMIGAIVSIEIMSAS